MIPALLVHVERAGSTNDLVRDAIAGGAPHGYAVFADTQTAGRGRHGRSWFTRAGESLPLSIAVVGAKWRPLLTLLPLAAAVATQRAVTELTGVDAGIKWPNDLMVGGRKLAGILCEGVLVGGEVRGAVIGVGLNVNLDAAAVPEALRNHVASLAGETGKSFEIGALAAAIRLSVLAEIDGLADGATVMLERWRSGSVTLGRRVESADRGVAGVAVDVAGDGGLVVRCDDGVERVVRSGEIVLPPG